MSENQRPRMPKVRREAAGAGLGMAGNGRLPGTGRRGRLAGMAAQAQPITDDALKMLVAQHGVRGTARLLEMDTQATEAFRKRVQRAGWCQEPDMKPLVQQAVRDAQARPVVSTVSPIQVLAASMKEDAIMGRAAALKAGRKALSHIAEMPAETLTTKVMSETAKNWGGMHATAAGYAASDSVAKVSLSVTAARGEAPPVTLDAEWSEEGL